MGGWDLGFETAPAFALCQKLDQIQNITYLYYQFHPVPLKCSFVSTIFPSKSHLALSPPWKRPRKRPRTRPAAPRAAHAAAPSDEWRGGRTGSGRRPGAPGDAGHQVGVFLRKTYWWMENIGFLYVYSWYNLIILDICWPNLDDVTINCCLNSLCFFYNIKSSLYITIYIYAYVCIYIYTYHTH